MVYVSTHYANCCLGIKVAASSDFQSNVYLIYVYMSVFGNMLVLLGVNDTMTVKFILFFFFILFCMQSVKIGSYVCCISKCSDI